MTIRKNEHIMFGLLKKKKPYQDEAYDVYARIMDHITNPVFYTKMGVEDTFDGRFDMLVVHSFMVFDTLHTKDQQGASSFNQALFDQIFNHMHVTLREIGVGDVGIPKHQQKMMKAFNGRMHSYQEALDTDNLDEALIRNLYGTVEEPDLKSVKVFAKYMKKNVKRLRDFSFDDVLTAQDLFTV